MNSLIKTVPKQPVTRGQTILMALKMAILSPLYLVAAWLSAGRGIGVHLRCMYYGLTLTRKHPVKSHARWIYYPLESTRYVEIDFVLRHAGVFSTYLDVSCPRQIPAILLRSHPAAQATLMNPDAEDLAETRLMTDSLGLKAKFVNSTVESFQENASYDLITCVSVLEHIPDEHETLRIIWKLLKPGGTFILTVPAYAEGGVQLTDRDPYGLNLQVDGGYFFQRFYSESTLNALEEITGKPALVEVWGEKKRGWLQDNFETKRKNPLYPTWTEPLNMARNWARFQSVSQLPGEGVYCAVYKKPGL